MGISVLAQEKLLKVIVIHEVPQLILLAWL